ncbi:unnamed protein product [Brachionus calyciflorus]|uniref:Uncharacterized protein n=1 Tax=Brachionus calyciflorus TaxID=104777 RepID=A0A814E2Q1_9BILA|nr:unnamed protein product [Brachionus calyciflorus]
MFGNYGGRRGFSSGFGLGNRGFRSRGFRNVGYNSGGFNNLGYSSGGGFSSGGGGGGGFSSGLGIGSTVLIISLVSVSVFVVVVTGVAGLTALGLIPVFISAGSSSAGAAAAAAPVAPVAPLVPVVPVAPAVLGSQGPLGLATALGSSLVVAPASGGLVLTNSAGQVIKTVTTETVSILQFVNSNTILAATSTNNVIFVNSAGNIINTVSLAEYMLIKSITTTASGQVLISTCAGVLIVQDSSGNITNTVDLAVSLTHVKVLSNNNTVVVDTAKNIKILNSSYSVIQTIKASSDAGLITNLEVTTKNGQELIMYTIGSKIYLINVFNTSLVTTITTQGVISTFKELDNELLVVASGNNVYYYNLNTSLLITSVTLSSGIKSINVNMTNVIVVTNNGSLVYLDSNGNLLVNVLTLGLNQADYILVNGSDNGRIKLIGNNGTIWREYQIFELNSKVIVKYLNEKVMVGISDKGEVALIDVTDGNVLKKYRTNETLIYLVIIQNDKVMIGSEEGGFLWLDSSLNVKKSFNVTQVLSLVDVKIKSISVESESTIVIKTNSGDIVYDFVKDLIKLNLII